MRAFLLAVALATAAFFGASAAFAQGQIVIINNNAPGVGFNDPTAAAPVGGNPGTTLGQQRLNAFNHAADIWEGLLAPKVDIRVQAQFVPLAAGVLGSAAATASFADFPGAEIPGTLYHSALADHLAGADLNPGVADIVTNFSTNFVFYLGFDNNEGLLVDLLPVVLHELGHGLGFANFVNETAGTLAGGVPDIYSQYTFDVDTGKNWNVMTIPERQASAINIRKVSWNGINVNKDVPSVLSPGEPFVGVNSPAGVGPFMFTPASFGAPLTAAGLTASVVLANDNVGPSTSDGCEPIAPAPGTIMIIDRGICTFVVKVLNAQNAGAVGVIIADNVAGAPPAGLAGADPNIVIPSGRVTLADGNTLKANLAAGLNVTLDLDTSIIAGTDRVQGLMMVAAFNPVVPGSSISHWDAVASRNQLMEPSINNDLTSSLTPPEDLTASQMTDIGWFSDVDGVPDGTDSCIGSDIRPQVFIDNCNPRTDNDLFANGCSINDELFACETDHPNKPLRYLACVARKTEDWARAHAITRRNQAAILVCALKNLH